MKKQFAFIVLLISLFHSACSKNDLVTEAQGFEPNEAPVITNLKAVYKDTNLPVEDGKVVSGMEIIVSADISDPEGKPLSVKFDSPYGSFLTPGASGKSYSVVFIAGNVKDAEKVTVSLKAADEKNAVSAQTLSLGKSKPGAQVSASLSSRGINSTKAAELSLLSDSKGIFQIVFVRRGVDTPPAAIDPMKRIYMYEPAVLGADSILKKLIAGPEYSSTDIDPDLKIVRDTADVILERDYDIYIIFSDQSWQTTISSVSLYIDNTKPVINDAVIRNYEMSEAIPVTATDNSNLDLIFSVNAAVTGTIMPATSTAALTSVTSVRTSNSDTYSLIPSPEWCSGLSKILTVTAVDTAGNTATRTFTIPYVYYGSDIKSFYIPEYSAAGVINYTLHTINVVVPIGTDLSHLVPSFTLASGASAEVGTATQLSGVTENDFRNTLVYVIKSTAGISLNYNVTVKRQLSYTVMYESSLIPENSLIAYDAVYRQIGLSSKSIFLTNDGAQDLPVESISIKEDDLTTDSAAFVINDSALKSTSGNKTISFVVPANATKEIKLGFKPPEALDYTAVAIIKVNDANYPDYIMRFCGHGKRYEKQIVTLSDGGYQTFTTPTGYARVVGTLKLVGAGGNGGAGGKGVGCTPGAGGGGGGAGEYKSYTGIALIGGTTYRMYAGNDSSRSSYFGTLNYLTHSAIGGSDGGAGGDYAGWTADNSPWGGGSAGNGYPSGSKGGDTQAWLCADGGGKSGGSGGNNGSGYGYGGRGGDGGATGDNAGGNGGAGGCGFAQIVVESYED